MKVAVIGSRSLRINDMRFYIPSATTEIVSGGAKGVDKAAEDFARKKELKYTEFLPEYEKYARAAPLRRNEKIIDYADLVVALWNSKSKGTQYVINLCKQTDKPLIVYHITEDEAGLDEISDCEYHNFNVLSDEVLKEIIMAELDGETESDVDIELINASIDAILTNKYEPIFKLVSKEKLAESFDKYYDMLFKDIIDKCNQDEI